MPFGAERPDEPVGRRFVREDAHDLLASANLLNEPFEHVCRAEATPILRRQGQDGRGFLPAAFQHLERLVGPVLELRAGLIYGLAGALRRRGRQNSIEQLMHPIAESGRRPVEDVAPEVYTEEFLGMTPLPYEPREGGLQRLTQAFVRVARGHAQKFLRMATSDAHEGLRQALEASFSGLIWQRCHTEEFLGVHFRRNVLDRTPAGLRDRMHELLDRILTAPSPERAREAVDEACAELEDGADKALEVLESGWEEATAVLALPAKYRRRLRPTNMLERFIEEIRRREKVVRIFPNEAAAYRLIGALCAERHEEWSTGRRYLTMDEYFEWKASLEPDGDSLPVAA